MPSDWGRHSEPIPGYRLVERLGRGGFGDVWKAEAPGGLFKAVKIVFGNIADTNADRNHATQELKALSRMKEIRHPFILTTERFDVIEGVLVIVMELADRNLSDRAKECRSQGLPGIPRDELLKYLGEASEALDLISDEYDLQHLDIKPQNLFLVRQHVKIADFGLVKDLEGFSAAVTGGVTPLYAPPETFEGWVSRNSDQYSLAIVYQEMLTGRRPFNGPTARELMMQHVTMEPDLSSLPEWERPIVGRALAKDPSDRYANCTKFIQALTSSHCSQADVTVEERPTLSSAKLEDLVLEEDRSPATALTQLANESVAGYTDVGPIGPIDTFLKDVAFETDAEGNLCPVLVVGVGMTGLRCLERMRSLLNASFGEHSRWPLIDFLGIDVDAGVVKELSKVMEVSADCSEQLVVCKLRKPNYYVKNWDDLKHLSSWLDRSCLFQMGVTGATNGHRALGRLALMDNYRRIVARVRMALARLVDVENVQRAQQATSETLRLIEPRVFVVSGMGGGAGSGMFIDLCYLIREILSAAGARSPDVQGILIAGVGGGTRAPNNVRVNHYALAQDLVDVTQPDAQFIVRYQSDGPNARYVGPPFRTVYLFDVTAESLPEESRMDVVFDSVAEFIEHTAVGPLGRRIDERSRADQWFVFRTLGWFSLDYPMRSLVHYTACALCYSIVSSWLKPIDDTAADRIREHAADELAATQVNATTVAAQLLQVTEDDLGDPIDSLVASRMERFAALDLKSNPADFRAHCQELVVDLKKLIGLDPDELEAGFSDDPVFQSAIHMATNRVADTMLAALKSELTLSLDDPGPRFEHVKRHWEGFNRYLLQTDDDQRVVVQGAETRLKKTVTEIRHRISVPLSHRETASVVVDLFSRYAREKIDYSVKDKVAQVFLVLRGRLADWSRELTVLRQHIAALKEAFVQEIQAVAATTTSYATQALFPGGSLSLAEAADAARRQLKEQRDALEGRIQEKVFAPKGGLATALTADTGQSEDLVVAFADEATQWVTEMLPRADVAGAFFDRHGTDTESQTREIEAFYNWAAPTAPARPLKDPSTETVKVKEAFFLTAPDSSNGWDFIDAARKAISTHGAIKTYLPDRCVFCRVETHPSLGRLLPEWVLKGRVLYDNARASRLPPDIFPQAAKR